MEKVLLITGATRGIGRAVARELMNSSVFIIGTATSKAGAEEISNWLNDHNQPGIGVELDLSKSSSVEYFLNKTLPEQPNPTIFIHNAGITRDELLIRMSAEKWDDVVRVNLTSLFSLSKYCLRHMLRAKWGRFLAISSVVAQTGNPGQTNYAATKAGIEGFTRALALEISGRGITANVISPGYIQTEMTNNLSETVQKNALASIPLKRFGKPEEVAALASFLVSEKAGYITGQTIHVNGGLYMN